jgi:hypothetical protein
MELIKKIIRALVDVRKKKIAAADFQPDGDHRVSIFTENEWQKFLSFIDSYEQNINDSNRVLLQRIIEAGSISHNAMLQLFNELATDSNPEQLLCFAELPVNYDSVILEQTMEAYGKLKTVEEQIQAIPQIFASASPTTLELLSMFLDGDSERYPDATSNSIRLLVERETVCRNQLEKLLSQPVNDNVRWWLIKSTGNLSFSARSFFRNRQVSKNDLRLECMALTAIIRLGLAWTLKQPHGLEQSVAELFFAHEYPQRIIELLSLTGRYSVPDKV